ncbi:hypothetical protein T484DRAFT_1796209, partial [Baffinella frigidus]
MSSLSNIREHVFGLFYVMTEGADQAAGSKIFSMTLLTIDLFDLVAVIADQLRLFLPYLCFFVLAVVMVIAAITDAIYVVKLSLDGVVTIIWPLK